MPRPLTPRLATAVLVAATLNLSGWSTAAGGGGETPPDTVALPAGAELRLLASVASPVVTVVDEPIQAPVLDRHEGWLRVQSGDSFGWWDAGAPVDGATATAEAGGAGVRGSPSVAGPWSADSWTADPEAAAALADARAQLGEGARWHAFGAFRLVTDVTDDAVLARLQTLATEVTALYAGRYGLPVPTVSAAPAVGGDSPAAVILTDAGAGTVILFADAAAYRAFAADDRLAAHTAGRLAALPTQDDPRRLRRLVAHELVHLLNRHAFTGVPPAWLDDGLAGDMELVPSRADGTLMDGPLGRAAIRVAGDGRPYGPLIALEGLLLDARRGRLETLSELTSLDGGALLASPRRPDLYALSALWIRFLLDERGAAGRARASAFRAHLAQAAASPTPVPLPPALTDPGTDADFHRWLVDLARRVGVGAQANRP